MPTRDIPIHLVRLQTSQDSWSDVAFAAVHSGAMEQSVKQQSSNLAMMATGAPDKKAWLTHIAAATLRALKRWGFVSHKNL